MGRGFRAIRADPLTFLERTQARYGDLVAFPVPGPPVLLVNLPADVRRVLQTGSRSWGKNTAQYAALATVTGPGLLAVADDRWLERRRTAQPAFHHGRLDAIAGSVRAATARAVDGWAGLPAGGATVDIDVLAMGLTLDVIGRTLFDHDLTEATARLVHATDEAAELVVALGRSVPVPRWVPTRTNRRLALAVSELDGICHGLVAARRRRGVRDGESDLLGLLVAAGLPDDAVRDELVTMVLAGHETVASALTWTLMLLAENPAAQARLRDEVRAGRAGPPAPGGPPAPDGPPARAGSRACAASPATTGGDLQWTRAVVDEALRIYPPGWVVSRRSSAPDVLAGQQVPAGTVTIVSPWLLHRRPDTWPGPEAFRPERFLDDAGTTARADYLPFGLGPRLCIGRDFALLELVVILAGLLRDHEVRLPPGWARPAPAALVTLRARGGLRLTVAAV